MLFRALWPMFLVCAQSAPSETNTASQELSQKMETPRIVEADYIDLLKIGSFTKFRSGEGHDFSDVFESCRSMKHYFRPAAETEWAKVKIFSPVKGTVMGIHEEWAGTKIELRPRDFPTFTVVIFHVRLLTPLHPNDIVTADQQLVFHFGNHTFSDIAVTIDTPR